MENNNNNPCDDSKADKKIRCRTLIIDGVKYRTQLTSKYQNKEKWTEPDKNMITSIIPGTVVTVLVRKGQKVQEGESLLVLESMKMQNRIACPRDGKVRAIKVAAGQVIPKGYVMVEIE